MNEVDSIYNEAIKFKIELIETKMSCLNDLVNSSNDIIANEIAASDRYWSIASAILGILCLILGIYITWCSRKVERLKLSVEQKEQDVIRLKDIIDDTNQSIQHDLNGLYQKLRTEETNTLLRRLVEVPEDVSNVQNLLLSRDLPSDAFPKLKDAFNGIKNKDESYYNDYLLLFFQHFAGQSLLDDRLRACITNALGYLVGCAFKNDIIKSTKDIVGAIAEMPYEDGKAFVVAYYRSLKNSKFNDLSIVFDELKTAFTNEQWQSVIQESNEESDIESEIE